MIQCSKHFFSGIARAFLAGQVTHPEGQSEEENEKSLRKNKKNSWNLRKEWGKWNSCPPGTMRLAKACIVWSNSLWQPKLRTCKITCCLYLNGNRTWILNHTFFDDFLSRHWQELNYLIVYVTARPSMQKQKVVAWLAQHNFPHGMVFFSDGLSTDPLRQKATHLRSLIDKVRNKKAFMKKTIANHRCCSNIWMCLPEYDTTIFDISWNKIWKSLLCNAIILLIFMH